MLQKPIAYLAKKLRGGKRSPPPNVVWICADDFTPDFCGAYGNRIVRTPSIDRLASEGIRFDRAYCTSPLSTPSRQSFWTGRYPRSIGVTLSRTPLPDDEVTLPELLRQAGYETAAFGKTHFYAPRPNEFDVRLDWFEYKAWLAERNPPFVKGMTLGPWRPFDDPARVWLNSDCLPYPAADADMFGTYLSTNAAEYLSKEKDRPFFLYVSYFETHSPFAFPVEFRARHHAKEFRAPEVASADKERIPHVFRSLSDADKRGILASYATSTEFMDKNVGLVLDALESSGHAGNTLVLFTSDHGYMLGQHGRFEKHCCYEPAVRAALAMRMPGRIKPNQATSAMVELHDLTPTILELCRVLVPGNFHGRSLVPLLNRKAKAHRERVFVEYADNAEAMVRTEKWKLIHCAGTRRRRDGYALQNAPAGPFVQLFDMENDPEEVVNLAYDPEHAVILEQLTGELARHLVHTARDPESIPATDDVAALMAHCLEPRDMPM